MVNYCAHPVLHYITCNIDDNDLSPSEWSSTQDHKMVPVIAILHNNNSSTNCDDDVVDDDKNKNKRGEKANSTSCSQITFA